MVKNISPKKPTYVVVRRKVSQKSAFYTIIKFLVRYLLEKNDNVLDTLTRVRTTYADHTRQDEENELNEIDRCEGRFYFFERKFSSSKS